MNFDSLREGRSGCPSDLTLERLALGDLEGDEARPVQAHAAACVACTQQLATIRGGFGAHPQVDPRRMLAAIRRGADAKPKRSLAKLAAWLLAPAAIAVAVVLVPRASNDDGYRLKGGAALHVIRATGEAASGDAVRVDEPLELRIDLPRDSDVQIVGVDPAGKLYPVWPAQGTVHQSAGLGIRVPGAVALDATPGEDTLFLVTCPARTVPACAPAGAGALRCAAGCHWTPSVLRRSP